MKTSKTNLTKFFFERVWPKIYMTALCVLLITGVIWLADGVWELLRFLFQIAGF